MRTAPLIVFFLAVSVISQATHIRAGHIQVKRLNPLNGTCEITIVMYMSTNGHVKMGGDVDVSYLEFGDGQRIFVPEIESVVRYDLDANGGISEARFVTTHAYRSFDVYRLSYNEPNRNLGVVNMDNSVNTRFYIETTFILSEKFVATPEFLAPPIFHGTIQEPFSASIAAGDLLDHTIFYQLTTPGTGNVPAVNYQIPENLKLNLLNGHISWDTKFQDSYQPGEYAFAAKVKQFDGDELLSTVIYEFQVILTEEPVGKLISGNRVVNENGKIFIPINTTSKIKVFVEDVHSEALSIDVFSELMNEANEGHVSVTVYDSSEGERKIKVALIDLTNTNEIARDNPYPLVVRGIYDRASTLYKHLTYLIYTRDIEPNVDIVLSTGEENKIMDVYPNPVNDMLHLDDERIKQFAIYSMEGVLLRSGWPSENRTIDVRSLTPGFYVLKLNAGRSKGEIVKLIKQ